MRFVRSILCAVFFLLFGVGGLFFSFVLLFPLPQAFSQRIERHRHSPQAVFGRRQRARL